MGEEPGHHPARDYPQSVAVTAEIARPLRTRAKSLYAQTKSLKTLMQLQVCCDVPENYITIVTMPFIKEYNSLFPDMAQISGADYLRIVPPCDIPVLLV